MTTMSLLPNLSGLARDTDVGMKSYWSYTAGRSMAHNSNAPGAFQVRLIEDGQQKAMLQFDFASMDFDDLPVVDFNDGTRWTRVMPGGAMLGGVLQDLASYALTNAQYSAYPSLVERAAKKVLGRM